MLNIYVGSDYNTWADENEREEYSLSLYNVPEHFIWTFDKFLKKEAEAELKQDHVLEAQELLTVLKQLREGYCKAHEQIKELKKEYEVSQRESEE
ncbi:MAG: hypothetical protein IKO45_04970 [Clostridia bacterium]|nr:hypothetical protein [Clostridia bacterium]MBR4623886.1 hypothetical protein [Clostridia bacterium]